MSLYVRVEVSFWNNRKTLRLQRKIGECAFWVPIKLWSYAANNQPDGDFSDYSDEEIAMLLGYDGDAKNLTTTLIEVGFLDADRRIHDWQDYHACLVFFKQRAKKAAQARWGKRTKAKLIKAKQISIASSIPTSIASSNAPSINGADAPECEKIKASPVPTAEEIYQAYPRKIGKDAAIRAIRRAMYGFGAAELLRATLGYAMTQPKNDRYTPYPATWFNRGSYRDDPATWVRDESIKKPDPRAERIHREFEEAKKKYG